MTATFRAGQYGTFYLELSSVYDSEQALMHLMKNASIAILEEKRAGGKTVVVLQFTPGAREDKQ